MPTYEMHLHYPSNGRVDVVHVQGDNVEDAKTKAVGNTPLVVLECNLVPEPSIDLTQRRNAVCLIIEAYR